jgi:uncharacterized protein YkwD
MTSLIRSNKRTYTRRNIHHALMTTIPEDQSCREWSLVDEEAVVVPKRRLAIEYAKKITRKLESFDMIYALIDNERITHHLPLLNLSEELARLAMVHATHMAQREALFHSVSTLAQLQNKLSSVLVGENVQRGPSCKSMHQTAMSDFAVNRNNILGANFTAYGVATVRANDGRLYMCQYFR